MEFCKKYDVKIIFRAYKDFQESVTSAIHILFDNPAKKKTFGIFKNRR
jgi:flagellum-specific peptidoglycan hydrolase FlgJ